MNVDGTRVTVPLDISTRCFPDEPERDVSGTFDGDRGSGQLLDDSIYCSPVTADRQADRKSILLSRNGLGLGVPVDFKSELLEEGPEGNKGRALLGIRGSSGKADLAAINVDLGGLGSSVGR
ncbi:hypothetical protein D3C81_1064850 [compost metagenome]